MSQQSPNRLAAGVTATGFFTSVPCDVSPLNSHDIPPSEWRYVDRTPTDEFLSAPLPGVALSRADLARIQIQSGQ